MSKKVLILSASPRKNGNSEILCDQFMKGAEEAGNQVEKISLRDKNIHYCTGCGVCNTTHQCVQTDDMAEILEKMLAADVIVMATPVYFYTMNAQMKTLIDRAVPKYTAISNKEFYFIVTAADTEQDNLERTIDGFRGFTDDCLEGAIERGVIYGVGVWHKGEVNGTKAMQQAYEMGKLV
ncbi:MAG: flavodoxin family protein [Bacillota bacterium]|nr:flavodoxin family protein [Bacillota bacterium]